ncbi:ATP-binding protein [bacterium]|nr:MAG: ATP-binding protein [bacterium]
MNLVPPWFEDDLRRLDALLAEDAARRSFAAEPISRPPASSQSVPDPWSSLVERLKLTPFERDLLLFALAADLDPRYGSLCLYLYGTNRPTAELALRLYAPTEAWTVRTLVAPDARLFRLGLIEALPSPDGTPWLARPLAPHPKMADRLIVPRPAPEPPKQVPVPPETLAQIERAAKLPSGSVIYLDGRDPALVTRCAEAIAGTRGITTETIEALASGAALLAEFPPTELEAFPLVLIRGQEPQGMHHRIVIPDLDPRRRTKLWQSALKCHGIKADPTEVSERFALRLDAIEAAASWVASRNGPPDLLAAAAAQTVGPVSELAQEVRGSQTWEDLVVPDATARRLRAVASAIQQRRQVFEEWGFGHRTGANGLKALFSGPSGSGKTMAVGIVGRELGLPVFRVDLASTVSKYIGETEKNLARIFAAADDSGAILFFDEADALFGKRSEVKDAHDRYANLEVAYLLQRMDDYDGTVILATNLSRNLDEAFSRRLHYVVEFPVPDAPLRRRLWRGIFPADAPLADDADLEFLADRFDLTGGRIQTIALDAAFMAARNRRPIGMRDLVRAVSHQLIKEGRIPSPADFGAHYESAVSIQD